jgi:type I restriction-modification system DNA methylase subunit
VLTNKKPEYRKGKVQLIDATQWFRPLRKNLGKKNCELSEEDIRRICETYLAFKPTEQSKIFSKGINSVIQICDGTGCLDQFPARTSKGR